MDHVDEVLLESIVREMVDFPQEVHVTRQQDEQGILLSLNVNPADMGKVIGVQGANAKALRTIMRCVGIRNNARINIKIIEPATQVALDELDSKLAL